MIRSFLVMALAIVAGSPGPLLRADEPAVPGDGFVAAHYETLWSKSPFSVASAEEAPDSPDYSFVGMAKFNGVSYASIIDKKTQEHFLLTSDKPVRGLTLVSMTAGSDPSSSFVEIQRDGQTLSLKLEKGAAPPAPTPNLAANANGAAPPGMVSNPFQPNLNQASRIPGALNAGGMNQFPPGVMFHRAPIHVPPRPSGQPLPNQPPLNPPPMPNSPPGR